MKLSGIAFRNVKRNTRRSILSMITIIIVTTGMLFMYSLFNGMKKDMGDNIRQFYNGDVRIRIKDYAKNPNLDPLNQGINKTEAIVNQIKKIDGVKAVAPRITFGAAIRKIRFKDKGKGMRREDSASAMGMGVDFEAESIFMDLEKMLLKGGKIPQKTAEGRWPKQMLIGAGLADEHQLGVGDKVIFMTRTSRGMPNAFAFTISGILDFPLASLSFNSFLAPLPLIQNYLDMPGQSSEILALAEDPGSAENLMEPIQTSADKASLKGQELQAQWWKNVSSTIGFIDMAGIIYNFMGLIMFLLGSTVIINTSIMVIYERMREIGTLNALGMESKEIVRLFFLESFYIALGGATVGILIGIAIIIPASIYGIDMSQAMEGMSFEMSSRLKPLLQLDTILFTFFYSLAVASLVSLIPAARAARIVPVKALQKI